MTTEQAQAKIIEIQEEMIKMLKAEVERLKNTIQQPNQTVTLPYGTYPPQSPFTVPTGPLVNPNPFVHPYMNPPYVVISGGSGGASGSLDTIIKANPETMTFNCGAQCSTEFLDNGGVFV